MNAPTLAVISHLTAGRSQIGTSLSFHLFFAVLGVGLPLMMLVAEGMHLRTGDPVWRALARRWSKVFAVLFAVGAASGTIISFELGLLFPRFMAYAGGIIGLPFSLEGAAFFIEAIFVGIYLYGWNRLSPRAHWLSGFPIAISAVASAFFIVTANAWMNVPRGFQIVHGRVTHVDPLAAMFNPAWATETSHMVFGAYLATAFGIASVYAVGMLRGRRDAYHRKAIALALSMAAILAPMQLAVGDLLGRTVANHQPATLAAIEGVTHTERSAGLNIGGFPLPGHNGQVLNVKVPHLLSVLAFDDPNAPVRGLDTFPKVDRTPLAPYVRLAFIGMVGIGTGLVALSLWYWLRRRRGSTGPEDRLTLMAVAGAGPAAFLANELGWLVSELGRQPWIVYGVFRTSSGITTSPGLGATFTAFTLLYVGLTALTVWSVRRIAARPVEGLPAVALGAAMSLPALIAVLLGVSLTAYALFAGADFGAGILDLLAGSRDAERAGDRGDDRAGLGGQPRLADLLDHDPLLGLSRRLLGPRHRAARTAHDRAAGDRAAQRRAGPAREPGYPGPGSRHAWPAVRSGQPGRPVHVRRSGRRARRRLQFHAPRRAAGARVSPGPGPSPCIIGALAAALCAQLAASFVALGMVRTGESRLAERFRVRGLQSGACVLVLTSPRSRSRPASAPAVWHRLIGEALPLVIVGLGAGAMSVLAVGGGGICSPAVRACSPAPRSCGAGSSPRPPT